jgi:hypothetical protein
MRQALGWLRRGAWGALAGAVLFSLPAAARDVAPHRAIYDLSLMQASKSSGVVDAKGQMLVELGDSCDGWTLDQRYRLTLTDTESDESLLVVTSSSWESKDGLGYRFFIRKLQDGDVTEEKRGRAQLPAPGAAGAAAFTQPDSFTVDLPAGTMFPTEHTLLLIRAAEQNQRFVSKKVFDGDSTEGPSEVTAAIGQATDAPAAGKPLLARRSWAMRLAYYKPDAAGAEPIYEVGMRLLDNGVAEALTLDYGDFVVRAKLREIESTKPDC